MHNCAVGNDAYVGPFANDAGFTERNREIRTWIFGTVIRLAVEMLVLEKEHGIIGANRGAKKAADIEGGGGHHDTQAGNMGKYDFAALAVVNRAAGQVAADGYADNHRRFEIAAGAPTNGGQLIA